MHMPVCVGTLINLHAYACVCACLPHCAICLCVGAKTPLAQFVTAWVVAFVLLWLTPVFSHLPYNVLGAVVVSSVLSLFEYELAIFLFRVRAASCLACCRARCCICVKAREHCLHPGSTPPGHPPPPALVLVLLEPACPYTCLPACR